MWRLILIILNLFNVVCCIIGWVWLIPMEAVGLDADLMRPGTFDSFVIPGWILLVVVGGLHLLAAIMLLRRRPSAAFWSAVAGFAMVIWIYVEVVLLFDSEWAHHFWGATGLAEIGCTLAMLGIFDRRAAAAVAITGGERSE